MLAAEFRTLSVRLRASLQEFFEDNYRWLAVVLRRGDEQGELSSDGDALTAAELVVGTLEGATLLNRPAGRLRQFDAVVAGQLERFTRQ